MAVILVSFLLPDVDRQPMLQFWALMVPGPETRFAAHIFGRRFGFPRMVSYVIDYLGDHNVFLQASESSTTGWSILFRHRRGHHRVPVIGDPHNSMFYGCGYSRRVHVPRRSSKSDENQCFFFRV